MERWKIEQAPTIRAEITVPGDKSISHRAAILAALSNGTCVNCWGSGPIVPPGEKYVGPAGPFDPTIATLCVRAVGATDPMAVLTSYNSHPHLYELPYFSGETAGACKRAVQSRLPGTMAMYAHGTGGNIDLHCVHPIPPAGDTAAVQWFQDSAAVLGRRFAEAVVPAVQKARGYRRPTRFANEFFSLGEDGAGVRRVLILSTLVLGPIAFVSMPGELFVEYGLELQRRSPVKHLFLMGYNGSVGGYVPPPLAFEQGSYEVMRGPAPSSAEEITTTATKDKTVRASRETGAMIVGKILEMLARCAR